MPTKTVVGSVDPTNGLLQVLQVQSYCTGKTSLCMSTTAILTAAVVLGWETVSRSCYRMRTAIGLVRGLGSVLL